MAEGQAVSYQPVIQAGGDTFGGGLQAGAALKGTGYEGGTLDMAAYNSSDLRHEVASLRGVIKDSESEIRSDVKDAECGIRHDIGEVKHTVKDSESAILRQTVQTGKEVENRVTDLERNVDAMFCKTNENIVSQGSLTREKLFEQFLRAGDKEETRFLRTWDGQQRIEDKIGSVKETTLERFAHAREEDLEEKLAEANRKLSCCECSGPTASETADVMVQKLLQLQLIGTQK